MKILVGGLAGAPWRSQDSGLERRLLYLQRNSVRGTQFEEHWQKKKITNFGDQGPQSYFKP